MTEIIKQSILTKILLDLIFIVMIIFFGLSIYLLYLNFPGAPEYLNVVFQPSTQKPETLNAKQFYPNMKFNHNNITYKINSECNEREKQRMIKAFEELTSKVDKIRFSVSNNPDTEIFDIEVSCSIKENINKDYFIAGEGGAKEIIPTGRYHIIETGIIYLSNERTIKCEYPNIELHELMHVFGFDHSNNEKSLMYPFISSCDQKLDGSLIKELDKIYSEENFPELYFADITAIKKGRYLDFNITIKNSGSISSKDVTLSVLDNDEEIETRNIGDLNFGAGIFLQTTNLKLIHKVPKKISFVIDRGNKIKEINEENNMAIVSL